MSHRADVLRFAPGKSMERVSCEAGRFWAKPKRVVPAEEECSSSNRRMIAMEFRSRFLTSAGNGRIVECGSVVRGNSVVRSQEG